jgi:lysophospholipase L1-like esterase
VNQKGLVRGLLQAALLGLVFLMAVWVKLPWSGLLGLGGLFASLIAAQVGTARGEHLQRWTGLVAWLCLPAIVASPWFGGNNLALLDNYYALLAWLIALVLLLGAAGIEHATARARWKVLGMIWVFAGAFIWTLVCYAQNRPPGFYLGLLIWLVLLIVSEVRFRVPTAGMVANHTLILLILGVPAVDWLARPSYRMEAEPDFSKRYYSYEMARKDPVAFGKWWRFYLDQWCAAAGKVTMPDPAHMLPFLLRPNSQATFFRSQIAINSLGFRGGEIAQPKGETYRIVALGESTTFGCGIQRDDTPWPEVLEHLIHERLHLKRPVEVINAGIPTFTLKHSLLRLPRQILPLKPDMIISYHGANGFQMIKPSVPLWKVEFPPAYHARPLKLLADAEYRLKMFWYHRHPAKPLPPISPAAAMHTEYARCYRELLRQTETNHIRLVLANYSMAVNGRSERDLIEFYRGGFPYVDWWIRANEAHSMLVAALAAEDKQVRFVDTHPALDGHHELFVDLMHFTGEGDRRMAETMFNGIRQVLAEDCR